MVSYQCSVGGGEFCRGLFVVSRQLLVVRFLGGEEIGLVGRRAPRIEGRGRARRLGPSAGARIGGCQERNKLPERARMSVSQHGSVGDLQPGRPRSKRQITKRGANSISGNALVGG